MRKAFPTVAALTFIWAMVTAASASAAFEAKEAKENSVTLENTALAISIKVEGLVKAEPLEVVCKTIKGEGAVMELPGLTGEEEKEDLPALSPTKLSDRIGLKTKLEGCQETLGTAKGEALVHSEKCQLEIFQEGKTAGAFAAFHASSAGKACTMAIEQDTTKCVVDITTASTNENAGLEGLKLKGGTSLVEVESGSEIKGIDTSTSGCSGIDPKATANLTVKKALTIKGVTLATPFVTLNPASKGYIVVPEVASGGTSEAGPEVTIGVNNTKIESNVVTNLFPVGSNALKLKANSDTCVNAVAYMAGEICTFTIEFKPTAPKTSYLGEQTLKGMVGGRAGEDVNAVVGRST